MRKLPKFNTFIYTGTFVFIFTMQIILSGNDLMKYFSQSQGYSNNKDRYTVYFQITNFEILHAACIVQNKLKCTS